MFFTSDFRELNIIMEIVMTVLILTLYGISQKSSTMHILYRPNYLSKKLGL